jgi:hypothetical protein
MSKKDTKKQPKVEKAELLDQENLNQQLEKAKNDKNFVMPPLVKNDFLDLLLKLEKEIEGVSNSKKDNEDVFIEMRNYYVSLATIGDNIKNLMDKMLSSFQEVHQKHINTKLGVHEEQNDVVGKHVDPEKNESEQKSTSKAKSSKTTKTTKKEASDHESESESESASESESEKEKNKKKSKSTTSKSKKEPEKEPEKEVKKSKKETGPEPEKEVKKAKTSKTKKEPEPKSESDSSEPEDTKNKPKGKKGKK